MVTTYLKWQRAILGTVELAPRDVVLADILWTVAVTMCGALVVCDHGLQLISVFVRLVH
jgi:hypothetical protein